jgi:hypothetical protein
VNNGAKPFHLEVIYGVLTAILSTNILRTSWLLEYTAQIIPTISLSHNIPAISINGEMYYVQSLTACIAGTRCYLLQQQQTLLGGAEGL